MKSSIKLYFKLFNINKKISVIILCMFLCILSSLPVNTSKENEETISDAELNEMLKDPKYSALLSKSDQELLKASLNKPEKESNKLALNSELSQSNTSNNEMLNSTTLNTNIKKPDSYSFLKNTNNINQSDYITNEKLDDIKSLNLFNDNKLYLKSDQKEDKFKDFDFLTKNQARFLIECMKQPVFYNMLPKDAKKIVDSINDNFEFKIAQDGKIDEYLESNMINSPTSTTFIDPDGQIGRKGSLTIIDPISSKSKFIWCVSNSKTLTFYQSQMYISILKLYRNSGLLIKDIPSTPCFMVASKGKLVNTKLKFKKLDFNYEGAILVCSNSIQDKELWISNITLGINRYIDNNNS